MDERIKLKISENTNKRDPMISKFTISYSGKKMDNSEVSYEIISALKEERDLVIELNSSLLNMEEHGKKSLLESFTVQLDKLGIEYKNKKLMVNSRRTFLSIFLSARQVEGFKLFAHIPNEIWNDREFRKIIPVYGLRYYLPERESENNFNAFLDLDEEERYELCSMVIFDYTVLGSMGINAERLTKSDVEELLHKI